ncbi:hypothetical protein AX16_003068 [Volvariella volvacea WC 439]|nr:hypothetical protein AX16_003068 [Volvariella volvacea WC 439]
MPLPRSLFARNTSKSAVSSSVTAGSALVSSKGTASTTSSVVADANDKDSRAQDHERQRAKKAEDVAKMRARKAQNLSASAAHSGGNVTSKLSVPKRPSSTSASAVSDMDIKLSLMEGMEIVESFNWQPVSPDWKLNHVDTRSPSDARTEVKLADLITTSTRKPRKRAEHDFEFIPHVRSVLVLDDAAAPEVTFDEPWEHIYGEDDTKPAFKGPSYASVVAQP